MGLMNEKRVVKEGEPPLPPGNYYQIQMCEHTAMEGSTVESSLTVKTPFKWEVLSRERVITLFSKLDPSCITPSSIGMVSSITSITIAQQIKKERLAHKTRYDA